MGTIVRFHPREQQAAAKTEAILEMIGNLYQQKLRAKEMLPVALARLIEAGHPDMALRAVALWGTGEMEPHDLLAMCEEVSAVVGVDGLGEEPL